MNMSAEQIKAYLEQRLENIIYNLEGARFNKEEYDMYYAQKIELEDILKTIR